MAGAAAVGAGVVHRCNVEFGAILAAADEQAEGLVAAHEADLVGLLAHSGGVSWLVVEVEVIGFGFWVFEWM